MMENITEKNQGTYNNWGVFVPVVAILVFLLSYGGTLAQPVEKAVGTVGAVLDSSQVSLRDDLMFSVEAELRKLYEEEAYVERPNIPSLFFTTGEHALLKEMRSGFIDRVVILKQAEMEGINVELEEFKLRAKAAKEAQAAREAVREISLAGILFTSKDDWIVWLNNTRMTPKALPDQVMHIDVSGEYVELRWYDAKTKTIFPVRLRPNQRFNLDARMFLPG